MDFDTAILAGIVGGFLLLSGIETLAPSGREMPRIRGWRWMGLAALAVTMITFVGVPLLIVPYLPENMALVDLTGWGSWAALPVWVLTTFLGYWAHRVSHYFDVTWRAGHQVHHAAVRVDMASAMLFHPVDIIVIQIIPGLIAAGVLGATAHAAGWAGLIGTLVAYFQHWNVRTPTWTGWFIQRPEAHVLHHERDVHARNFGDMPVWDRLFGTYGAPEDRVVPLGFAPGRGRRWLAMAVMVDVNKAADHERHRVPQ